MMTSATCSLSSTISLKTLTLQTLVADDLAACNRLILESLQSSVPLVTQLAEHLIKAGGKRLRPLICLSAAQLCGYEGMHHLNLAASVEFIHAATLLHDDVIDTSLTRRGQETANALWGNQASVLVGDFLFAQAFQLMVQTQSVRVLEVLSQTARTLAEGEVWQLSSAYSLDLEKDDYFKIIEAKTSSLFAAAAQVGAILSQSSPAVEMALHTYGHALGMIFQIIDDILDYSGTNEQTGKNIGDDFFEGKVTLPLLLAYQQASSEDRLFLEQCWQTEERTNAQLSRVQSILRQTASIETCYKIAQDYGQEAVQALDIFPDSALKAGLIDTIDFCLDRSY